MCVVINGVEGIQPLPGQKQFQEAGHHMIGSTKSKVKVITLHYINTAAIKLTGVTINPSLFMHMALLCIHKMHRSTSYLICKC